MVHASAYDWAAPIDSPPPDHGGDLAWAEERYPDAERPWIDLSTGINPWPYPPIMPPADMWTRLPTGRLDQQLRDTAANYYGVADSDGVVAAPGSQALIQVLPRLRPRGSVAIVAPTYSEHAACWQASGHRIVLISAFDAIPGNCDVAVVTNPNNPDGRTHARDRLVALADGLARRGGWLVVDEAFADVVPGTSLADRATLPGLIVLRSFGKFFGLAGLRLGFALVQPRLARTLKAALGPWAVSGPAAWIGTRALTDAAWIAATRTRLSCEAARLDALLNAAGLRVIGGTALFRTVESRAATRLFDSLCRRGIFARHLAEWPNHLRFGLPADGSASERLRRVLCHWQSDHHR